MTLHVVTDSSAHFFLPSAPPPGITIMPNRLSIAGKTYREGIDLSNEEAVRLIAHQPYAPQLHAPSVQDYHEVYSRLARSADGIISIHASREIFPNWGNARAAAQQLMGNVPISVIDTGTLSTAQAMLVKVALKVIETGASLDEVERQVRGAIERVFSVYHVDTTEYLLQNQIMSPSHVILGMMLGIKPLLTVENGRLKPMEKVRTRIQSVERLVEFAVEFTEIEDAVIVQHRPNLTETTRMLQDRLAVEFNGRQFPYAMYGASLAALIGGEATGFIILECETDEPFDHDDDF